MTRIRAIVSSVFGTGLPLFLAAVLVAAIVESFFVRPELRVLRMLVCLAGLTLGAVAPARGLAVVALLAGAGDIVSNELLRRPDMSLAELLLAPLCAVALVRALADSPRSAVSGVTTACGVYAGVILLSATAVMGGAMWSAHLGNPALAWTPHLDSHVFRPLGLSPVVSLAWHAGDATVWAARWMMLAAGAFLFVRTSELPLVAMTPARLAAALSLALGITCAVGIWQWFFPFNLDTVYFRQVQPGLFRIDSTWPDPNSLACFLLAAVPVAAAWAAWPSAHALPRPILAATWVAAGVVLLGLTGSRSAYAGVAAAAALLSVTCAALAPRWNILLQPRLRRAVAGAAVAAVLLPPAAAVVVTASGAAEGIHYGRATSRLEVLAFSLDLHNSPGEILTGRVRLWEAAIALWKESPIFGVGTGQFAGRKKELLAASTPNPDAWRGAHNAYLEILAETGLVGLAALLGVAVMLALALDEILRTGAPRERLRALALAFALTAIGVAQLSQDWIQRRGGMLTMAVVASLVLLERQAVRSRTATGQGG